MKLKTLSDYRTFALLSVVLQVLSIVVLKYAAIICGEFFCWSLIYYYAIVAGFIFLRVMFWNLALSKRNLSDVYIFTALNPVLLLWLSSAVLNEKVSIFSTLGSGIVVFAIFMQQRKDLNIA